MGSRGLGDGRDVVAVGNQDADDGVVEEGSRDGGGNGADAGEVAALIGLGVPAYEHAGVDVEPDLDRLARSLGREGDEGVGGVGASGFTAAGLARVGEDSVDVRVPGGREPGATIGGHLGAQAVGTVGSGPFVGAAGEVPPAGPGGVVLLRAGADLRHRSRSPLTLVAAAVANRSLSACGSALAAAVISAAWGRGELPDAERDVGLG